MRCLSLAPPALCGCRSPHCSASLLFLLPGEVRVYHLSPAPCCLGGRSINCLSDLSLLLSLYVVYILAEFSLLLLLALEGAPVDFLLVCRVAVYPPPDPCTGGASSCLALAP